MREIFDNVQKLANESNSIANGWKKTTASGLSGTHTLTQTSAGVVIHAKIPPLADDDEEDENETANNQKYLITCLCQIGSSAPFCL